MMWRYPRQLSNLSGRMWHHRIAFMDKDCGNHVVLSFVRSRCFKNSELSELLRLERNTNFFPHFADRCLHRGLTGLWLASRKHELIGSMLAHGTSRPMADADSNNANTILSQNHSSRILSSA